MRFDLWLEKHKDRAVGIRFTLEEYVQTGYNPVFKYRYCELFIRCYQYALNTYRRLNIRVMMQLNLRDWLMTHLSLDGMLGNLARDIVDCLIDIEEKLKYCKKYCRHFETAQRAYTGDRYKTIKKLNIPSDLRAPVEGVARISPYLMAHLCFHGFEDFIELDDGLSFKH